MLPNLLFNTIYFQHNMLDRRDAQRTHFCFLKMFYSLTYNRTIYSIYTRTNKKNIYIPSYERKQLYYLL